MFSRRVRKWAIVTVSGIFLWLLTGYISCWILTCPRQKDYKPITNISGSEVQQISLLSSDGIKLNCWHAVPDSATETAVILLAGIGGNSSDMADRASIYLRHGISVLMPDLRGTGKSEGDIVSFGWQEKHDLLACFRWLKSRDYQKIGVHGCSLGAATIAYSLDSTNDYSFMVMESCYDNIDHAFAHRLFDSGFNRQVFWPVYYFTENKTGASADELSPLNRTAKYYGPLLYLAGDKETQITIEETKEIFTNFGSSQKELCFFSGAPHCDLYRYDAKKYRETLNRFIRTLKTQP